MVVYSKPVCVQCDSTKRLLDRESVDYEVIDVSESPEALEYIKGLGYLQAPVVVTETEHWSGFRPDKIMQYV